MPPSLLLWQVASHPERTVYLEEDMSTEPVALPTSEATQWTAMPELRVQTNQILSCLVTDMSAPHEKLTVAVVQKWTAPDERQEVLEDGLAVAQAFEEALTLL